jgi:hypothetical protein
LLHNKLVYNIPKFLQKMRGPKHYKMSTSSRKEYSTQWSPLKTLPCGDYFQKMQDKSLLTLSCVHMCSDYCATDGHWSVTNGQSLRPICYAWYCFIEIARCRQTVQLQGDTFNPLPSLTLQNAWDLNVPCRPTCSKVLLLSYTFKCPLKKRSLSAHAVGL